MVQVASPHSNEIHMTPYSSTSNVIRIVYMNTVDFFFPPFGAHLGPLFSALLLSELAAEKCLSL